MSGQARRRQFYVGTWVNTNWHFVPASSGIDVLLARAKYASGGIAPRQGDVIFAQFDDSEHHEAVKFRPAARRPRAGMSRMPHGYYHHRFRQ